MFQLTDKDIKIHYNELTCSWGYSGSNALLYDPSFTPETFTVYEKRNKLPLIIFNDLHFDEWVYGMIDDIIKELKLSDVMTIRQLIFSNVMHLLDYEQLDREIYNQEFVDIIRRVVAWTITGDPMSPIKSAQAFNQLAFQMIPESLRLLETYRLSLKQWLKISIISGLSGLDLKGAPAAASSYSNTGIRMQKYFAMDPKEAALSYTQELLHCLEKDCCPIFHFEQFDDFLCSSRHLVWLTDDYIESCFDMMLIQMILQTYPISITMIPKNGYHGNDLSYDDFEQLLSCDIYDSLKCYYKEAKFRILNCGPRMGAANLRKMSDEAIDVICGADGVLMKGCRIFEMLQGGLSVPSFTAFNVVRKVSEINSGFNSQNNPALFFFLEPGEYAYWGMGQKDAKCIQMGTDTNYESQSTIREHFHRKSMEDIIRIEDEMTKLLEMLQNGTNSTRAITQEINMLQNIKDRYMVWI